VWRRKKPRLLDIPKVGSDDHKHRLLDIAEVGSDDQTNADFWIYQRWDQMIRQTPTSGYTRGGIR
jgi:hypothetical protein